MFKSYVRGRTLKQILCKHDFKIIANHKSVNETLEQCKKCRCYRVWHRGINASYEIADIILTGWERVVDEEVDKEELLELIKSLQEQIRVLENNLEREELESNQLANEASFCRKEMERYHQLVLLREEELRRCREKI